MINIGKRINEIDEKNPTVEDLKYVSIASFYMDLKKNRDYKNMRRLNYLIYYFPSIVKKNGYHSIIRVLKTPDLLVRITGRRYDELNGFEKYAVDKTAEESRNDELICAAMAFKTKYFFEYFKL